MELVLVPTLFPLLPAARIWLLATVRPKIIAAGQFAVQRVGSVTLLPSVLALLLPFVLLKQRLKETTEKSEPEPPAEPSRRWAFRCSPVVLVLLVALWELLSSTSEQLLFRRHRFTLPVLTGFSPAGLREQQERQGVGLLAPLLLFLRCVGHLGKVELVSTWGTRPNGGLPSDCHTGPSPWSSYSCNSGGSRR